MKSVPICMPMVSFTKHAKITKRRICTKTLNAMPLVSAEIVHTRPKVVTPWALRLDKTILLNITSTSTVASIPPIMLPMPNKWWPKLVPVVPFTVLCVSLLLLKNTVVVSLKTRRIARRWIIPFPLLVTALKTAKIIGSVVTVGVLTGTCVGVVGGVGGVGGGVVVVVVVVLVGVGGRW